MYTLFATSKVCFEQIAEAAERQDSQSRFATRSFWTRVYSAYNLLKSNVAILVERTAVQFAGKPTGLSYLYLGCRSRSKDYYYREQFEDMHKRGVLTEEGGLQVACSRDQPKKIYVQDLLAENCKQLFALICQVLSSLAHVTPTWILQFRRLGACISESLYPQNPAQFAESVCAIICKMSDDSYLQSHSLQGASIYVSGSAQKMPQDVATVFKEVILQQSGGLSAVDAHNTMRLLISNHRYVVEAWS